MITHNRYRFGFVSPAIVFLATRVLVTPILANLVLATLFAATALGVGQRGVQFSTIDFNAGTIELTNFDFDAHDMTDWYLCSHDDDDILVYGRIGGSIEPGEILMLDVDSLEVALPFDNDAYSIAMFDLNNGGFGSTDNMIDLIQWSIDGQSNANAAIRTGQAVTAGLWINADDFIATTPDTTAIQLADTTGGVLHSPDDYTVISMPALNCDVDGDGACDLTDIDMLLAAVGSADSSFDLDNSGRVDSDDIDSWLESAGNENQGRPFLAGDANFDGIVDSTDLNAVGLNWQSEVQSWSAGDFNGDGQVDSTDLNSVGLNWQRGAAVASSSHDATVAVPEPAGMRLAMTGLLLFLLVRCQISKLGCRELAATH